MMLHVLPECQKIPWAWEDSNTGRMADLSSVLMLTLSLCPRPPHLLAEKPRGRIRNLWAGSYCTDP